MGRDHAQAGRDGHRGHDRKLAQAGRRHGRVRRPALRGVHRQGRLGDPQPVRRRDRRDPGAGGGDRAGRHARWSASARPGAEPAASGADRLPSAAHGVAAAGGPALGDPASPSMGGSEGMAGEDPALRRPGRRGARHHDAQAGRDGHRGHDRELAQAGRRHGGVRRPAVRGEHRQGRLGDPQPVRRRAGGGPGRQRRDRPGRRRAGPHRRARRGARGRRSGRHPGTRGRRPRRPRPRRPPADRHRAADRNGRMLSPLVRRLVAEAGLDVAAIPGTGEGGRIRREDVERAIASGAGDACRRTRRPGRTRGPARTGRARPLRPSPHRVPPHPRPRRAPRTRATRSSSSRGCAWPSRPG